MIETGSILKNKDLCEIFKCGSQGGMRRSLRTNSLIIVSDHTRGIYKDRWEGNILYYTGMGLEGDQSLQYAQNKTLVESSKNGVNVHLFEVFKSAEYIYQGRAKLARVPFKEKQLDQNKDERDVWIFPLKLMDQENPSPIPEKDFAKARITREKVIRRLSDEELAKRVKLLEKQVSKRQVLGYRYDSSEEIKELAKRKANGKCMLCRKDAPFSDKDGFPFLEGHHIVGLAEGGPDSEDNVVALCPNCHRKMHHLGLEEDKIKLEEKAKRI